MKPSLAKIKLFDGAFSSFPFSLLYNLPLSGQRTKTQV